MVLLAGFLSLNGGQEEVLDSRPASVRGFAEWRRLRAGMLAIEAVEALKVEEELAANGVNHRSFAAECETGAGADEACLNEWVRHPGYGFHRDDRVADGGGIGIAGGARGLHGLGHQLAVV